MFQSNKIILVTGLPGVGKTTFSKILSRKLSLKYINAGECIKAYLEQRGHNLSIYNKAEWGEIILNQYGEEKVYDAINFYVENDGGYIIDGIRLFSTYLKFSMNYFDVKHILVKANENLRKDRLSKRIVNKTNVVDQNLYFKEAAYLKDYNLLLSRADFVFNNSIGLSNLNNGIENFISQNFK